MKKHAAAVAAIAVVIVAVGLLSFRQRSQISIIVNGKRASNLPIREFGGAVVARTDGDGVASKPAGVEPESLVGFRPPGGGFQSLSFPPYGHREYRFEGRTTTVIWHKFDYAIVSSKTETTTVAFTEEETRQLEAGERTFEDFPSKR